ncbi:MAG TPA: PAS domain S-box protein, partial [Syntrophomonas sp.]|nr:PAS domain S-box protein [Syntrophomonas sp.]
MGACNICGNKVQSSWKFCPECGTLLDFASLRNPFPFDQFVHQIDDTFIGMFMLDQTGHFIYCNEALAQVAGYASNQLDGKSLLDIVYPDDMNLMTAAMEEIYPRPTRSISREIRLTSAQENAIWVNMNIKGRRNQNDPSLEFIGICFDISRQKAAEAEVSRQNTIMDLLHETSLAIINRLDVDGLLYTILKQAANLGKTPHGYIYRFNRETETMEMEFGIGMYTEERVVNLKPHQGFGGAVWRAGQPVVIDDYRIWPGRMEDPRFDPRAVIGVPLKAGDEIIGIITLVSVEENRVFSQSEVLRLSQFGQLASIALNNALMFCELKQEIAERKKAEEALYESTEKLRAIIGSAKDFVYLKDSNLVFQEINPAMYERLGLTREEVIGKTDQDLFGAGIARQARETDQRVLAGETVEEEIVLIIDNVPCVFDNLETPLRGKDTNVTGISGIMRDITERKKAEKEMLHAKEIVARSEKLASLGTMAAGISHEINQPLNSIKIGSTGLIYCYQKGIPISMDEIMEEIEEISLQADRIDKIIKHMRSFTRSKDSTELYPCKLNEVIEHALELVNSQISDHGIVLHKHLEEDLPLVRGTETGLEEIVINLVVNSIQALDETDAKHKEIKIVTRTGAGVILEINDNGPGVNPEIKNKIFDPFFTTKEDQRNMGFGLSITHSIVSLYQGKID